MSLSKHSLDWIVKATRVLNDTSFRPKNFYALEGLPCAGKTTTVMKLRAEANVYIVDEVRLPPTQESCKSYLLQEPLRAQRIESFQTDRKIVLGDRSAISTLAHKSALLTYQREPDFSEELKTLEKITTEDRIFLPSKVVCLTISVDESRRRQEVRNRDALTGRLWYSSYFLALFNDATNEIISRLCRNNYEAAYIDAQGSSFEIVYSKVKQQLEE